jgi:hypothetical protein
MQRLTHHPKVFSQMRKSEVHTAAGHSGTAFFIFLFLVTFSKYPPHKRKLFTVSLVIKAWRALGLRMEDTTQLRTTDKG